MDHRTRTALKGSIKKWEDIVAGTGGDHGTSNCPLCAAFFWDNNCRGCPVYEYTDRECCDGSPYEQWCEPNWTSGQMADTPERKTQAQAMLDFLKSLLP